MLLMQAEKQKIAELRCLAFVLLASIWAVGQQPCVILSTVEPAKGIATLSVEGRHEKHMLTYLAGEYLSGIPFRTSIKDKDVDKIKAKGGRVIVLDPHYTHDDLENAKKQCHVRQVRRTEGMSHHKPKHPKNNPSAQPPKSPGAPDSSTTATSTLNLESK
jgi:hypothetical protein